MLQSQWNSYVCWSCLARGAQTGRSLLSSARAAHGEHPRATPLRLASRAFASVRHASPSDSQRSARRSPQQTPDRPSPSGRPSIYERLAKWEAEHGEPVTPPTVSEVFRQPWAPWNNATRAETSHGVVDLEEEAAAAPDNDLADFDLAQDLQPLSSSIHVGDLVEIMASAKRVRQLAVCVARIDGIDHLYADNGCWVYTRDLRTNFIVPGFATPDELAPVRDALPPPGTPDTTLDELRERRQGPTRAQGEALLRKMVAFPSKSDAARQKYSARLEDAYSAVVSSGRSFITAVEAAELVLPPSARDPATMEFPSTTIHAVHSALSTLEIGFRPYVRAAFGLPGCLYEVFPAEDVQAVRAVQSMVRAFYLENQWPSVQGNLDKPWSKHRLGRFVARARRQIDRSRRLRNLDTPRGMLGPSPPVSEAVAEAEAVTGVDGAPLTAPRWLDDEDADIMRFMYIWAACRKFSPGSRINVFGATILKALDRYRHCENLDTSVGWTFLQEVGWVLPWDVVARHQQPQPGVTVNRIGGLLSHPKPVAADVLERDVVRGPRKDWGDTKVYCIDSASTTDVDDGLSIKRTSTPGQYWIHVHVSDPTSSIQPKDPAAVYAGTVAETMYLAGHFERMFPDETIRERFSLAPGRRCLTFSAKVDESGSLLDYDITPGILRNVVYMTVDELQSVCPLPSGLKAPKDSICVGPVPPPEDYPSSAIKPLSRSDELSPDDVEDLRLLGRLADARLAAQEVKGAMPPRSMLRPRPQARASFDQTRIVQASDGSFRALGDPSIEISYPPDTNHPVVSASMLLAGEVAGRWCGERDIPVPFRTMPQAQLNMGVLLPYARDVLYPKLLSGRPLDSVNQRNFTTLTGYHQLQATPGPYFLLGLDAYVKVTSPLRRYGDLLAHWQIHAALAEEARSGGGGSLIVDRAADARSSADRGFLPFSREKLEAEVLPMLKLRELAASRLSKSHAPYSVQALARAWRFGQAPLPETFRFRVVRARPRRPVEGSLVDFFDLRSFMVPAEPGEESPLDLASLQPDEMVEVRLKDVDPSAPLVVVEAVRKLDETGSDISNTA